MSNQLAISQLEVNNKVAVTVEDVKKYLCPTANDKEIHMFVQLCRSQNLNPWIREAYLIKYGTGPATMVVGKDLFTKRAQANPKFKGFNAGIIVERKNEVLHVEGAFKLPTDKLLGGWAKVYLDGYQVPIEAVVSMEEYGKQQSSWKTIPATMIRKVALVQALREAFPEELGGLYDEAEIKIETPQQISSMTTPLVLTPTEPKEDPIQEAISTFFKASEAYDAICGTKNNYKDYLKNAKGQSPEIDQIKTWKTPKQIAWLRTITEILEEHLAQATPTIQAPVDTLGESPLPSVSDSREGVSHV